jgi:Family of unknown function (DUF6049)
MLVTACAALLAISGTITAGAATGGAATAEQAKAKLQASSAAAAPLTLTAQTPWVTPGQPFDLRLRPGTTAVPAAGLGVSVTVYSCLSSVSAFDQSVSSTSGPSGEPISSTQTPLAVSGLPSLGDGVFDLSMPVQIGQASTAAPTGSFVIHLTSAGVQCGAYPSGVYPVRVQLINTSGGAVIGSITTHLVYTESSAGTEKLRFAVVLPVNVAMGPTVAPTAAQLLTHPSAALQPTSTAAVTGVSGVVTRIADHPTVPVTIEVGGVTVETQPTVASQLAQLAATPGTRQFASAPYAPVDASGLVDTGLTSELALQVARGSQVLVAHQLVADQTPAGGAGSLGAWITNDALDAGTVGSLVADGYGEVVLPADVVTSPPTDGSTAEPFALGTTGKPTVTALTSNGDLAARFTGSPGNPVLAAHQLVAELAQMYYEKPNASSPRGVIAVAPSSWSANPAFVDALLGSLAESPIVQAVTTAQLFTTLSTPAGCRNGCRLIPPTGGSGLPAKAIRAQRLRIDEFASAAIGVRDLTTQLGDLVLAGESEVLRPGQQSGVLHNAASAVDAQLGQLVIAGDRTITFTSQQGTIPVTIVSTAPYAVTATLTLTSDKLLFKNGTTEWTQSTTLAPKHTNVVDVSVRTRVSGLFKVAITLHSPSGALELSSGEVNVRSTATSVVGVVLSLGAIAVLAVWWIRTSRKRRVLRRADALESDGVSSEAP